MISLAGHWERGWNTPIKEADLWEMVAREFGIDKYFMTPVSGIDNKYVVEMRTMQDIIDFNEESIPVIVDEKAEDTLEDFEHPDNALYIFGRVGGNFFNKEHKAVKVITPCNTSLLWPHQIATLILYDRMVKSWQ